MTTVGLEEINGYYDSKVHYWDFTNFEVFLKI